MSRLIVEKSVLSGKVELSGAKNSALKLQTASLLTDEKITLHNFPNNLSDIKIQNGMLGVLGKKVNVNENRITIEGTITNTTLEWTDR